MADVRRILILTADAGFGHRSAANAIAVALEETHGHECTVDVVNPLEDERAPALLRSSQADYDTMVRETPELYKLGFQASDAKVPSKIVGGALALILYEVMRDVVKRYQPDAIVTTYPIYQAALGAVYATRRRHIPLLTVVTDLAVVHRLWFSESADLCLVATPTLRDLALQNGLAAEKVRVTGIPVHPNLAREGRRPAEARAELGWPPELTTVLAAGSKRVEHLPDVLRALNHSGLPLQLAVVAGGDNELYGQLQSVDWHVPTHVYRFVPDMSILMLAADCIISKAGGLIITEALACGLPLLLIDVLPGQEVGNAEYVVANGAGELATDPLEALESLCHWLTGGGELLATRSENARRLGRPRAAYEVAELAFAAAHHERRAEAHHEGSKG